MTTYSVSSKNQLDEYLMSRQKPLAERLRERAKGLRRQAAHFEGCSWLGDVWPGSYYLDEANDLEEAARKLDK